MAADGYNLAIETSGRVGSIALGRGDRVLATRELPHKRRHDVGLIPAIDTLCGEHGVAPRDLREVYVSLGPGSFTGLRVGITTAKMLALSLGVRLVGVPTIEVLAANAPADADVAVCLNVKKGSAYCAVYRGGAAVLPPALRTTEELFAQAPRPLAVLAEVVDGELPPDVTRLPESDAVARAEVVYRLGRARAAEGSYVPAEEMVPLYVREPEAVTLWNAREAAAKAPASL